MKKVLSIALLICLFGFVFMGCNKDEEDDNNNQITPPTINKALLYDKWWYPSDGSVISNVYYYSNGNYKQEYMSAQATGTWNWVNNSDTMFISSPTAGDWYQVFPVISDHAMSLKMDLDSWAKEYQFDDTP